MRFKTTFILVLILLLLGLYVLYVELPGEERKREEEVLAKRLFPHFERGEVVAMTVSYQGEELSLEKDPENKWRIVRPLTTQADSTVVENVLSFMENLEIIRIVDTTPKSLTEFGLDPPAVRASLTLSDRGKEEFILGDEAPTKNGVYVKKEGEDQVVLAEIILKHQFPKSLKEWRNKDLLEFDLSEVMGVKLLYPDRRFTLVKRKERDQWELTEPLVAKADNFTIRNILVHLNNLNAEGFVDEKKEEQRKGFSGPTLSATLDLSQGTKAVAFYKSPSDPDFLYAVTTPDEPIYTLHGGILKDLDKDLTALRDKTVLSFSQPDVKRIEINGPIERFALFEDEKDWYLQEEGQGGRSEGRVDPQKVTHFLDRLTLLRVEEFIDDEPSDLARYGLVSPHAKISLFGQSGTKLDHLLIGKEKGKDLVYVKGGSAGSVYAIKKEILDNIPKKEEILLKEEKGKT